MRCFRTRRKKAKNTRILETLPELYRGPRFAPAEPTSIEDTGLSLDFLSDLALRIIYKRAALSGYQIADALKLPFVDIVDRLLKLLRREHLVEVKGSRTGSLGESAYHYGITEWDHRTRTGAAREVMNDSAYVGPAPVPLESYKRAVAVQSLTGQPIVEGQIRNALVHLVLPDKVMFQIGAARPAIDVKRR